MLKRRYKGQAKAEFVFPAGGGKLRAWVPDTFARVIDELGFNDTGEFTEDAEGNPISGDFAECGKDHARNRCYPCRRGR
jgi:hypothetical protein